MAAMYTNQGAQLGVDASYESLVDNLQPTLLSFLMAGKRLIEEPSDHALYPGLATVRQRSLLWFAQIASTLEQLSRYPAIATLARDMEEALSKRWDDLEDAPLFPAFREASEY